MVERWILQAKQLSVDVVQLPAERRQVEHLLQLLERLPLRRFGLCEKTVLLIEPCFFMIRLTLVNTFVI